MHDLFMKIAWGNADLADPGAVIYRCEQLELDPTRFELRADGERVHVEPQVLSLLLLLVQNPERMISKDELVEKIWDGRFITDSAIAARMKAARKAIGDDGKAQRLIRTVHGKGFRFVGEVRIEGSPASVAATVQAAPETAASPILVPDLRQGRPSIAVLPFRLVGEGGPHDIIADALPEELIGDLARLRWLFVIARGSSFRFRGPDADGLSAGRALGVRYCLTGSVERSAQDVIVNVNLVDIGDGGVVWSERFRGGLGELAEMRGEIASSTLKNVAVEIPANEVRLARGRPTTELDSWSAFHLGLDHMYRFNKEDNARAAELFGHALERDPYFARAMGGLSFTHFQNAFLQYGGDPQAEIELSRELAQRAVECDRMDPFAHFNLGRSSWLDGRLEDSIAWFDRATSISPSFAQGSYNRGLVGTLAGLGEKADRDLATAIELSPLDPMSYAMHSSRALVQVQLGDLDRAAEFGAKAALMPGAHKHIDLVAAICTHLAGRKDEAASWLARMHKRDPEMTAEKFFRSFPFAPGPAREPIERALRELGL